MASDPIVIKTEPDAKQPTFSFAIPTAYKVYEQKHAIQKNADIGTYYISAERFATLSRFEVKAGDIMRSSDR